jgi:GNAT superfamily N-acetyltransferase
MNISITPVIIREHYEVISDMMLGLHESERALFDQTDEWFRIRENYMRHVMEMQEACDGTCIVAYVDGVPAGFVFGYIDEEDEDSRIETYTGKDLYISDGYVAPAYRRMGLYKMMNAALERIYVDRGVRRMLRFTLTSNVRMQQFLEGQGYTAVRYLYEKWLTPDGQSIIPLGLKGPE